MSRWKASHGRFGAHRHSLTSSTVLPARGSRAGRVRHNDPLGLPRSRVPSLPSQTVARECALGNGARHRQAAFCQKPLRSPGGCPPTPSRPVAGSAAPAQPLSHFSVPVHSFRPCLPAGGQAPCVGWAALSCPRAHRDSGNGHAQAMASSSPEARARGFAISGQRQRAVTVPPVLLAHRRQAPFTAWRRTWTTSDALLRTRHSPPAGRL